MGPLAPGEEMKNNHYYHYYNSKCATLPSLFLSLLLENKRYLCMYVFPLLAWGGEVLWGGTRVMGKDRVGALGRQKVVGGHHQSHHLGQCPLLANHLAGNFAEGEGGAGTIPHAWGTGTHLSPHLGGADTAVPMHVPLLLMTMHLPSPCLGGMQCRYHSPYLGYWYAPEPTFGWCRYPHAEC